MKRQDMDKRYTWDLSSLFDSDAAWEKTFGEAKALIPSMDTYKGRLLENAETLLKALKAQEAIEAMLTNLMTYAHQRQDEDTRISTYQGMVSRMGALISEAQEASAFVLPELLSHEYSEVQALLEHPELKIYKQYFEDLFRRKPHVLSEEMERLLAQAGELGGAPKGAYGMLLNADMQFEDAVDAKGVSHTLTNGSYIPLVMSSDRVLRKNAFDAFYKGYASHINTIASLMQSEVKKNIFFGKAKKHASAREAALFENNVPVSVPDKLIEAVHNHLGTMHRYMKLRKKAMGLDALHMYDVYAPMVEDVTFEIPYEEAQHTVVEALAVLGDAYQNTVKSAFDQRWIDVYENEGKRSGAYSWGTYDSNPFILLNHKDNLKSMFTLAHEMGHSMHSYMTHAHQPRVYGHYSIFVAEVASTTNEALLMHYLLQRETDPQRRKYILNHYLEQFRGTIFRQTMFAEFERDIHRHVEAGGALTAEFLCDHYLELNKKYFGPDVVVDEAIKYEWARIPHMYMNFYVYQYATGFSAAIALADGILNEGQPALDRYMAFLSAGCSDYPINVLRLAGADMETEVPVANALKVFAEVVDEMEKLV